MKNFTKMVGITAMTAVIGLSFASCADDEKKAANAAGAAQTIGAVANVVGAGKAVEAAKNAAGKVTVAANGGAAAVAPASDFEYELTANSEGIVIKRYKGSGRNIIVPDTIEGFPVTEVGEYAFMGSAVTSVVLPDSIKKLVDGMFADCRQLQTVILPKGLTEIPERCFTRCKALTSITIPDTVTVIRDDAFAGSGLTSIVIPEGVVGIGRAAFGEDLVDMKPCENLTSVTLPESIQVIEADAFENCTSLETVNLPSHQFLIVGDAFTGCVKLPLATQKAIRDANDPDTKKYENPQGLGWAVFR